MLISYDLSWSPWSLDLKIIISWPRLSSNFYFNSSKWIWGLPNSILLTFLNALPFFIFYEEALKIYAEYTAFEPSNYNDKLRNTASFWMWAQELRWKTSILISSGRLNLFSPDSTNGLILTLNSERSFHVLL